MANFTPNQNDYKNLTPFKTWLLLQINTWGQNNFPFVESDFDELTNYGMMQKLMKAVNDVISNENMVEDDMTNIFNAFTELQNYINNYFDNLDLQNEVNVKLDEMAENGTLTNLIKNYVDPIQEEFEDSINQQFASYKNQVNSDLNTMNTKINNITSGTPIPVSSISEMTNTSRIYLLTTDGYWYYYNGSEWVQGELYQSMGINPSSVTYDSFESTLKDSLEPIYHDDNVYDYEVGFITNTGELITEYSGTQNKFYIEVDLDGNEIFDIKVQIYPNYYNAGYPLYMIYDNENNVIYTEPLPATEGDIKRTIICPALGKKLRINCTSYVSSGLLRPKYYLVKRSNYIQSDKINYNQMDSVMKTLFEPQYEEEEKTIFFQNGYLSNSQSINIYTNWNIYEFEVEPYELIKITGLNNLYTNPVVFFGSKDVEFTQTINDIDYTQNIALETLPINPSGTSAIDDIILNVPAWCTKIYCVAHVNNTNFKFMKCTNFKVNADETTIDLSNVESNPLKDKTLCFMGDSIMAATSTGVKGWVGIMSENNPNTNFYNYGHDGYTIAKAEDDWSNRSIQNVLPTILSEHPTSDYIVFQGGANDYWGSSHGITLGEISSGYNPNNFDRTTFSGGMEYIINYLYTNFPKTKIVFIVTHQVYASNFYQFMDRAKEICKKWAVPYIDLFDEGNINFQISYMRDRYSRHDETHPTGDGLHPNLDGYEIETPLIENTLKYKI